MSHTIMVAVDGMPGHRAALDWAASRAARDGARLELVHVIERGWGDGANEPGGPLVVAVTSLLDAEKEIALRRAHDVTTRYRYGHIGPELVTASRDADLLVIGTPPEAERRSRSAGSLAVRVAAVAECAVAVVPHGWAEGGHGVVVGVDGELQTEAAVEFAAVEAEALGEPLTVACAGYVANPLLAGLVPEVTLGDHRERIVAQAEAFVRQRHAGVRVVAEVLDTAPSLGLVAESDGSRMLVIGTHDRHGVQRLMLGSVGHDILLDVRTPVVVVRSTRPQPEAAGKDH